MVPLLVFVVALLLGVAAGRWGGWKGWLVAPAIVAVAAVASLASEGYVDPFLFLFSLLWAATAAIGVLVGLLLRRRRATPRVS